MACVNIYLNVQFCSRQTLIHHIFLHNTQVAICINNTQEYKHMHKLIKFEQEKHERRQRNFVKVGGEEERRRREHLALKLDYLPENY